MHRWGTISDNQAVAASSEHKHSGDEEGSQSKKRKINTARSQVEDAAKDAAKILLACMPALEEAIEDHPDDIIRENKVIRNQWYALLLGVDRYATWGINEKRRLNLRLKNEPGMHGMDIYNEQFDEFSKLITQLVQDLPSPSEFAKPDVWPVAQESCPILCLRPADAKGLPLCTLHDVFRRFRRETSVLLPNSTTTAEAVAARIAASKLCLTMGDSFEDDEMRGMVFDSCLVDLFPVLEKKYVLKTKTTIHPSKVNRAVLEDGIVIALREDKPEPGHGECDVYMQIARDYDLLVKVLTDRAEAELKAKNFIAHGAPCFLICVLGPLLFICGGFYDGDKPVVEPLCKPAFMLYDDTRTRHVEVATLLWALFRGISSLRQLVYQPPETKFAPSTPRIYKTCTLIQQEGQTGTLTFQSKFSYAYQRLFLATLDSSSYSNLPVFVKLVSGSYSEEVQQFLASNKLAPKLYGYAKIDGAPTAYIMEYLNPSNWTSLYEITKSDPTILSNTRLREALKDIVDKLKSKKYVHGDLRTNNIMIRTNPEEDSVELRVIDFDWAGKANETHYPAERNPEAEGIKWPGKPGHTISEDDDAQLVSSWLFLESSTTVY